MTSLETVTEHPSTRQAPPVQRALHPPSVTYWLVTRTESARRPEVAVVVDAIPAIADARRAELLGEPSGAVAANAITTPDNTKPPE